MLEEDTDKEQYKSPDEKTVTLDDKISTSILEIDQKEKTMEGVKPPVKRIWTAQDQHTADEMELAKLINKGIFFFTAPFCKTKKIQESDIQTINIGGGVVGSLIYFFPWLNVNHPLIVLGSRILLFFIRFRQICSEVIEKVISPHTRTEDDTGPTEKVVQ